ncbi:MAG TPA: hypothetical protein VFA26_13505, partial [Gemmataceae bacterium]|nr:hypothetical protein [Gemmataceae bacterium]
ERDLAVVRGLAHRDLEAILEVVRQARDLPAAECPRAAEREQDPPQVGWLTNVLLAVLGDLCVRRRLAANLVAANQDVKLVVRARLNGGELPEESLLTRGWRARHVLPELQAVLEGRRSLRVADLRAETPFAVEEEQPPGAGG